MDDPLTWRADSPTSETEGPTAEPWRTHLVTGPRITLSGLAYRMTTPLYEYHSYQGTTNDCGPHSTCIVANALLGEERFDPQTVAEALNHTSVSPGPFPRIIVRRIPNWATFPWGITDFLNHHDFHAKWHLRGNVERLLSNLRNDVATMVMIGEPLRFERRKYVGWGHVKILYGYDPLYGYGFVDPGSEKDPSDPWERMGIFWQDEPSFLHQWAGLFRIYIEVTLRD